MTETTLLPPAAQNGSANFTDALFKAMQARLRETWAATRDDEDSPAWPGFRGMPQDQEFMTSASKTTA